MFPTCYQLCFADQVVVMLPLSTVSAAQSLECSGREGGFLPAYPAAVTLCSQQSSAETVGRRLVECLRCLVHSLKGNNGVSSQLAIAVV